MRNRDEVLKNTHDLIFAGHQGTGKILVRIQHIYMGQNCKALFQNTAADAVNVRN